VAGTVTVTEDRETPVKKIKWTWTSDGDGNADLVTAYPYYGVVAAAVSNPGATAPTDDWDFTITDVDGYDVMQGAGADRDTSTTEPAEPPKTSMAHGRLTLNVSNAGDSKTGTVTLYIIEPQSGVHRPPWSR
jgi:hypothetical protein